MFDQIFRYKKYTRKLANGPLAPYLNEIATFFFQGGHSRRGVRQRFVVLGELSRWMRRRDLRLRHLTEAKIEGFVRIQKRRVHSARDRGDLATLKSVMRILRGRGVVPEPQLSGRSPADRILLEFKQHLVVDRNLSSEAIRSYTRYPRILMDECFGKRTLRWSDLAVSDVHGFLKSRARSRSDRPHRLQPILTSLRSFFRFLKMTGRVTIAFDKAVPDAASWKGTGLPYYLSSEEVERLLHSCDRTVALGKRNYAILVLLARLGLRACEVVSLNLEDVDWSAGEIITRGKGTEGKRLPISREVGHALVDYLRNGRPRSRERALFLRSFPPYKKLGDSSPIGALVRKSLKQAGLTPPKYGSHLLRHTAATDMLRKGATLGEIGMILGHQDINSTALYAKVEIDALSEVALPWPADGHAQGGAK